MVNIEEALEAAGAGDDLQSILQVLEDKNVGFNRQEAAAGPFSHMDTALLTGLNIRLLTVIKMAQQAQQQQGHPGLELRLTLKEFIGQPIPKLGRRRTDRASNTKTRAKRPRTFTEVMVWESFRHKAISRFEALDDSVQEYLPQVTQYKLSNIEDLSACQVLHTAADEAEVRGYIYRLLEPLSYLAPDLGLGFEYIGAGSNRNLCFTDLLLRERRNTDIAHLSAANWGIIEVKGSWQLSLPDNMSLADAINHPNYRKEVLPALQQAYGDAVFEETPIFAISNYDVTFFCHRHRTDAKDKRIWASPPVAWDSVSLPPRAAWLQFLAVAQECSIVGSKNLLLRHEVPSTPTTGYPVASPRGGNFRVNASIPNGYQTSGRRQQPARQAKGATKRAAQADSFDMQASSSNLTLCPQPALSLWLSCLQGLPHEDAIAELPWVKLGQLRLTMDCLGSTSLVRVMKAHHGPNVLAMKIFNGGDSAAVDSFVNELKAYDALSQLQGQTIPALHTFGQMAHTGCPTIVTHWSGQSVKTKGQLSTKLLESAREALQAMHHRGVTHGDVHLRNMLVHKDKIIFCDLGLSSVNASSHAFAQDLNMLDDLMR